MGDSAMREFLKGKTHPTDLILVLSLSIVSLALVVALPDGNIVRIVAGIPLMILFPGYALVSALWPKAGRLQDSASETVKGEPNARPASLGALERIALSFGLSLALLAFAGLALNYTPVGITFGSTVGTLAALIFILGGIAYYRRARVPVGERFAINFYVGTPKMPSDTSERFLVGAVVACVVISGCALGYVMFMPNEAEKYTEFYLLDSGRNIRNYPVNVTVNRTVSVYVGLTNHEYGSITYTIVAGVEGANITDFYNDWTSTYNITNGSKIGRNIPLQHSQSFEDEFAFMCGTPGRYMLMWALSINGVPSGQEVHLWINAIS